jgi:hypothetical protein
MRKLLVLLPLVTAMFSPTTVQAGVVAPTPVTCWFFQGEQLKLKQTCIYQSASWAGGGGSNLTWEDGVKTNMAWGRVGRGEKVCQSSEEMKVDGLCGKIYYRDPKTNKRISGAEREHRVMNNQKSVSCVQIKANSVCWL